jgi:hypothetical protein
VSIPNRRRGGGGTEEGGNLTEATVSGRQRLQINRGGDNDGGEESEEAVGEQGREKMTQRHPYPEASSERNSAAADPPIGLTHREMGHRRTVHPSCQQA